MSHFFHHAKHIFHQTKKRWEQFQDTLQKKKEERKEPEEENIMIPKKEKIPKMEVEISVASVTKGAVAIMGILLLIYFFYSIQGIIVLLFVSLILAAAINPLVDHWQTKKIPRSVSVLILYLIFLFIFGAVVYSLIPIIVEQIITLTQNIGKVVNNILSDKNFEFPFSKELRPFYDSFIKNIDKQQLILELQKILSTISTQLANIAGNSLSALGAIFNGILNAFIVLVITFFMVIDKKAINGFFRSLIPTRYAHYFTIKTRQMQEKIGGWVRGQFLLCLSIGVITYIGLFILQWFGIDIQYKETLAVVAGVTEIIPFLGPVIGAIPAVLIATNISGWAIFWVIMLYFIIQTLENNVIVNLVMNKEVGLNPIIIMVAMMIGAQFFGVLGVLLAIPVATSISVLVEDYLEKEK